MTDSKALGACGERIIDKSRAGGRAAAALYGQSTSRTLLHKTRRREGSINERRIDADTTYLQH